MANFGDKSAVICTNFDRGGLSRSWYSLVRVPKTHQRPPKRPKTSATLWAHYGGKTASPKKEGKSIFAPSSISSVRVVRAALLHGLVVGEILVFLLFRGKLTKHANHGMRQDAIDS